jgi:hypothetical protein
MIQVENIDNTPKKYNKLDISGCNFAVTMNLCEFILEKIIKV